MKMQICYICKEKYENKYLKNKKYCKFRDHFHNTGEYRGAKKEYAIENIVYLKKFL